MKGLYICLQDFKDNSQAGVNNKILDQVSAFNNVGINMKLLGTKEKEIVVNKQNKDKKVGEFHGKIDKRLKVLKKAKEIIINEDIEYVYIRYFKSDFSFINFLKQISGNVKKIVIEIPTYPYENEVNNSIISLKKILNIIDKIYRRKLNNYVDNIVTFSSCPNIFNIKTINIDNGINVKRIKIKNNKSNKKNVTLIGVAALSFWHGYDRVINGIKRYYENGGTENVTFNIVGEGEDLENLKGLVESLNLNSHVKFLGVKTGKELDEEFDNSDIAVGSLGIHRLNLKEVSTLKLREYIARGIPFLYAYKDSGIKESLYFAIKFPADESYIDINKVISFIKKNNFKSEEIRTYSEKFSWENQIKKMR
ncbi:glycosyltransferase [Clostridium perfringens]|uniref:glycosyltransferase n=1 Tax=Clostridium perfringens TaxID=1502 RepID=UPI0024BC5653|nr:glycosyltransferase [Clostridium perfringens]